MRSLRLALWQLFAAAAAIAGIELTLFAPFGADAWVFGLYSFAGLTTVAVGAVAWARRPSNATGALLALLGFLMLAAAAGNTPVPALIALGSFVAEAPIAATLHLVLAFPSGRLQRRDLRALVVAGYVSVFIAPTAAVLFGNGPPFPAMFPLDNGSALIAGAVVVQRTLGSLVLVLSAVVMIRGLRATRAATRERRALTGAYAYGIATILFFPLSASVLRPLLGLSDVALFVVQITAVLGIPFVILAAMFRGGYAHAGGNEELGRRLSPDAGTRPALRDAVAQALGDSSVRLVFPTPGSETFTDPHGRPVESPAPCAVRGVVPIVTEGDTVAMIDYDAVLIAHPSLVESAGHLVAFALVRERLAAELVASRAALRDSRARILEVADAERRRFAQDLHDLLQNRLVVSAVHANRLAAHPLTEAVVRESAERLEADLEDAIAQLRRQVQGLMPSLLLESGLGPAVDDLVDRLPLPTRFDPVVDVDPLPPTVASAAYFVVAEALANVVKHASAKKVRVSLTRRDSRLTVEVEDDGVGGARSSGSGLRGIRARADALDGVLTLVSEPGVGTLLRLELPCGS